MTRTLRYLPLILATALLAGPTTAEEKREPIEKLEARAISLDPIPYSGHAGDQPAETKETS